MSHTFTDGDGNNYEANLCGPIGNDCFWSGGAMAAMFDKDWECINLLLTPSDLPVVKNIENGI